MDDMRDKHQRVMRKSVMDAIEIANAVNDEMGYTLPEQMVGNIAMHLYSSNMGYIQHQMMSPETPDDYGKGVR